MAKFLNEHLPKLVMRWFRQYTYDEAREEMYKLTRRDDEDFIADREFIQAYIEYLETNFEETFKEFQDTKEESESFEEELSEKDKEIADLKKRLNMPLAPMLGGGGSKKRIVETNGNGHREVE
jgi:septal ring factor EnvC (AmiA/AmiB activator)